MDKSVLAQMKERGYEIVECCLTCEYGADIDAAPGPDRFWGSCTAPTEGDSPGPSHFLLRCNLYSRRSDLVSMPHYAMNLGHYVYEPWKEEE